MKKYTYEVQTIRPWELENGLNAMAEKGWRTVSVFMIDGQIELHAVFEKEIVMAPKISTNDGWADK